MPHYDEANVRTERTERSTGNAPWKNDPAQGEPRGCSQGLKIPPTMVDSTGWGRGLLTGVEGGIIRLRLAPFGSIKRSHWKLQCLKSPKTMRP